MPIPTPSRPDLSSQNSFSGRSSPAVPSHAANHEGIDTIDTSSADHTIAFDPRDMEEGEERLKFPKLTLMEEVLLLGLKDKQVTPPKNYTALPTNELTPRLYCMLAVRVLLTSGLPIILE